MMRSDMPKQVQVFRNGGGITSLATVPLETNILDQPHKLAYISPAEEQMLREMGGSGLPGPGGIASFITWSDIKAGFSKAAQAVSDTVKEVVSGGSAVTQTYNSDSTTSAPTGNVDFTTIDTKTGNQTRAATIDYGSSQSDDKPLIKNVTYYDKTGEKEIPAEAVRKAPDAVIRPKDATYPLNINDIIEKIMAPAYVPPPSRTRGGGGGGAAPKPKPPKPTVITPFDFSEDQLTARSDYIKRIGDIQGRFSPEDMQSFETRRAFSQEVVPSVAEFKAITGASDEVAQQLLSSPGEYDLRDWNKIMSSDNPLEAAQAATAAIYMTEGLYGRGQEIASDLQLANLNNLIGQTDQLFAYGDADDVRLGVKTADGVKLADLGSINSPDFFNVLQGYGYGAEDVSELLPSIEKYYQENVPFGVDQAQYKPVSELDYDYETYYTPEQVEMYNKYYANANPDMTLPLLGSYEGQEYFLTNAPAGRPGDPYNLLEGLQSAAPGTVTKDLGLGQSFLYSSTPGYYGLSDPVMAAPSVQTALQVVPTTPAPATPAPPMPAPPEVLDEALPVVAPISSGTPTAPTVYTPPPRMAPVAPASYSQAIMPNPNVANTGIMQIPSNTAYSPTYTPAVSSLILPPIG